MLFAPGTEERQRDTGARTPANDIDTRRLALNAAGLLDAPAEERFDRLTRLARRLLRTPVALVSLLDTDRQFFLSAQGLPEPWASLRETPLSHSFCRLVVETGRSLAVQDARQNPRVRGNPAIEVLGVVAYLAVPLALPDGCTVGALCAIDHEPRRWAAEDEQALTDLAAAVMDEFAAGLRVRELNAAATALRESEARYRALIAALGVAVYTTDTAGRLAFYNEAAVALWGWRPPLGDTHWCGSWQLYRPDGAPMQHEDCPMEMALRENRPIRGEAVAERPDRTRVPFLAYPTPLQDEAGALIGGVNVLVDITACKAAEAALRESEARLRSIVETVPDAMVVTDEGGTIESFSATAEQLFGYATDEVVGRNVSMLMPNPDRARQDVFLARHAPGERGSIGVSRIVRGRHKNGVVFPMEITLGEARLDGRRLVTGFARDLTERQATAALLQELQVELLHVSRLSAAGEMASALAHELNQPLTAVASAVRAAQRVLASLPGDPIAPAAIHEAIDLAAEQALRAGQIVRRLRDFVARDGEADKRLEDLAKLAEDAGALALAGVKESGIKVMFRFDPQLAHVLVDRIQIQQVLLNLMRNALEAMAQDAPEQDAPEQDAPEQDAVAQGAAEHDGAPPQHRELAVTASAAGPESVEVIVADTGPGLAPEIAGRLFNSFVSTKPGGMGMGLSISRSIVEAHGGRLWAEPNPGRGTAFHFTLPTAAPETAGR